MGIGKWMGHVVIAIVAVLFAGSSAWAVSFDATSTVATTVSGDGTEWFCTLDPTNTKATCAYRTHGGTLSWCAL